MTLVEQVRHLLVRCDRLAGLRAFITVDAQGALAAAEVLDRTPPGRRRPLHGTILAVKDNIDVAGCPTTAGTPALHAHVPRTDATVVRALREAGAIVLARPTRNTKIASILGWPSVSLPAFSDADELPFGMDPQAPPGQDGSLLDLAAT